MKLLKNMRATTCEPLPSGFIMRYHATAVFVADNGKITLNSGGWRTSTTKNRINWCLEKAGSPWRVFQKDFDWYVSKYLGNGQHGEPVPFKDGMQLDA